MDQEDRARFERLIDLLEAQLRVMTTLVAVVSHNTLDTSQQSKAEISEASMDLAGEIIGAYRERWPLLDCQKDAEEKG